MVTDMMPRTSPYDDAVEAAMVQSGDVALVMPRYTLQSGLGEDEIRKRLPDGARYSRLTRIASFPNGSRLYLIPSGSEGEKYRGLRFRAVFYLGGIFPGDYHLSRCLAIYIK